MQCFSKVWFDCFLLLVDVLDCWMESDFVIGEGKMIEVLVIFFVLLLMLVMVGVVGDVWKLVCEMYGDRVVWFMCIGDCGDQQQWFDVLLFVLLCVYVSWVVCCFLVFCVGKVIMVIQWCLGYDEVLFIVIDFCWGFV